MYSVDITKIYILLSSNIKGSLRMLRDRGQSGHCDGRERKL